MDPVAIYVHTPFCPSKCGYCDFNSYAMQGDIVERTTRAMIREIESSPWKGTPAKTIFLGGGTPTFLSVEQLTSLIETIISTHPPIDGCEFTSEANPGTVDIPKFKVMRSAGVNRISLGAQSFLDSDLKKLERVHESAHIERAVHSAREAGFENLNLDLMFALPQQTPEAWKRNLSRAIQLRPDHLSLYCLTIEPNTRFYKLVHQGKLKLPSDEVQVSMYNETLEQTISAGYEQYEISNFAKPGFECRHNLCYWHAEDYIGYGPGAVGCVTLEPEDALSYGLSDRSQRTRVRYTNMKHPKGYSDVIETGGKLWCDYEELTTEAERMERIMLGLRLNEGLSVEGLSIPETKINRLEDRGWIVRNENRMTLTNLGKHFCSEAVLELV